MKAHPSFGNLVAELHAARSMGELNIPKDASDDLIAFYCFTLVHGAAMLRMGLFREHAEDWDAISDKILELAGWMIEKRDR